MKKPEKGLDVGDKREILKKKMEEKDKIGKEFLGDLYGLSNK